MGQLPKCHHVAQLSTAPFFPLLLDMIIMFEILDKKQNKNKKTPFFLLS